MKYLIVNADDYGITAGVSEGIVEAYKRGVVRSTTMFANSECFEYAVSLLRENPNLGVGVHLNLTFGKPVSSGVPSIVGKDGLFRRELEIPEKARLMKSKEIECEFTAQIEKIRNAGIDVTHLDLHQHIYKVEKIWNVATGLALKYGIGIRRVAEPAEGVKTTEKFTNLFHNDTVSEMNFKLLLRKFHKAESLEIMCHPGYFDVDLMNKSRYAKKREIELAVLTKYELQAYLESLGIHLVSFRELP